MSEGRSCNSSSASALVILYDVGDSPVVWVYGFWFAFVPVVRVYGIMSWVLDGVEEHEVVRCWRGSGKQ